MEKLYVTPEGLDKIKAELKVLNERRMKVAETIAHARSMGDLSENAEYHYAKHEQAMVHAKIRDLEDKITRCILLDTQDIDTSKVYLGARVRVLNKKSGKEITYTLVSQVESDLASGKISAQSLVGKSLLGRSVGEIVTVTVPAGDLDLEILEITR
jgi:transcription elongation factor GreA